MYQLWIHIVSIIGEYGRFSTKSEIGVFRKRRERNHGGVFRWHGGGIRC